MSTPNGFAGADRFVAKRLDDDEHDLAADLNLLPVRSGMQVVDHGSPEECPSTTLP
jgi:hypothetical protein